MASVKESKSFICFEQLFSNYEMLHRQRSRLLVSQATAGLEGFKKFYTQATLRHLLLLA